MIDGELFHSMEYNNVNIKENYKNVLSLDKDNVRLYVLPEKDSGEGFHAIALEFHSCAGDIDNWWDDKSLQVDIIAKVCARFDGVRHIWIGEEGYLYYQDPAVLSKIFSKISELEEEYCDMT